MREEVIMGNRKIDVQSKGRAHLGLALELLANGSSLAAYLEEDGQLVLFPTVEAGATALLVPYRRVEEMVDFVWLWLEKKAEHRGRFDGNDTWNEKGGFRAWCGDWGHDEKHSGAFGRVEARYVWIGK